MKGLDSSHQEGQSLVEYALLIVLVALVVIGVLALLGVSVAEAYCRVVTGIGFRTEYCQTVDYAGPDGGGDQGDDTGDTGDQDGGDQDDGDNGDEETTGEEEEEKSGTIFFDDFSGDLSKWDILSGNKWKIQDEQLCNGSGEHQILAIGSDYDDYTVSVDAIIHKGQGYGVFFRATENGGRLQGYVFQYDPGHGHSGRFLFREWINGYERDPLAAADPPRRFKWYDVQRHIVVNVSGNTFTAYIDGVRVLTAQSDSIKYGQAGLRTWGSADVCFDNFTVTVP